MTMRPDGMVLLVLLSIAWRLKSIFTAFGW